MLGIKARIFAPIVNVSLEDLVPVEPLFGEGKAWHGMERFRLRMLEKVNIEALVIATGQNLKRLLSWRGWGRRWWPGGALGVVISTDVGVNSMVPA